MIICLQNIYDFFFKSLAIWIKLNLNFLIFKFSILLHEVAFVWTTKERCKNVGCYGNRRLAYGYSAMIDFEKKLTKSKKECQESISIKMGNWVSNKYDWDNVGIMEFVVSNVPIQWLIIFVSPCFSRDAMHVFFPVWWKLCTVSLWIHVSFNNAINFNK